jgi:hypothetical protein
MCLKSTSFELIKIISIQPQASYVRSGFCGKLNEKNN